MKIQVNYEDIFKRFNGQLPEGVFLNTNYEENLIADSNPDLIVQVS